ncbi:RNA polymerase II transcription factor B subunit 4 [Mortierella hygrophila]|uniref:General transcription and DNA repair factor IIH subunit TFB4 n=1 Tax=Mortierella hygrophila TaxID=979708 RepID=A0A9P6FJ32_9FUNG|nr:RNA polymerase II transcription factor B subunit 4 [Mortierella hygrophila]
MKDISTNDSNLLVMVIDTNPFEWEHPSAPLKLNEALQHILAFMNAHLAGRHDNKLAVIASHVGVSKFLYPTPNEPIPGGKVPTKKDANAYQSFKVVNEAVLEGVERLLRDPKPTLEEKDLGSSKIAASLSLGLCYINQTLKLDALGHVKPRILVLTVSPDSSSDYIPIMNCIFSAQKANIPIDVCKIWGEDAVFLQQAAHITEGIYMRPNDPRGLLQVLMDKINLLQLLSCLLNVQNEIRVPASSQSCEKIGSKGRRLQPWITKAEHSNHTIAIALITRIRMLDEQAQNHLTDMDMDVGSRSVLVTQNEKIIFCIDLDLSMDEHFMIGEKLNDTRINRTKQVLKWFIAQKSKWNAEHEFAVIILGEKAVWYLEALHVTRKFFFDCVYIHNKASEVTGDIKPQEIYDRLTEMEDTRSPGYFYELTRVLKKFSVAMGELLANPAVRAVQEDGFPRMASPPSVRATLEMMEQQQQQQSQKQALSPNAKRPEIPVRYKSPEMTGVLSSPTFFGGAAGAASQLSATATGGNGTNAPRTPPPPPSSHTAAARSTSPFGAASPSRGARPELSQVSSRPGSVTGMRSPPSGPGGAAGGGNGSGTGGNSGAGTGMDDAILI